MTRLPFLTLFGFCLLLAGCGSDDDPIIENSGELITDFTYQLTPTGGGETVTFTFLDPDGDGGTEPQISVAGTLVAGTSYSGTIDLADSSGPGTPDNITEEVEEEAEDHQFFFLAGGGLNVTVAYADTDANGDPIGLRTTLTTAAVPSTGTLTIILRHEPNKAAPGIAIDNPAVAGGETDIELAFPLTVAN